MIVSRRIISQWIDISNISNHEIANALNNLGFEVEKVINLVQQNTKLIIGQIVGLRQHPTASRLKICNVNCGIETVTIICGANNININDKVIVAQVGSKLATNITIGIRKIQDIVSTGMICSLQELGLHPTVLAPEELDGVVILPTDANVGDKNPLAVIGLDDTIFALQLTLNRSDCLSMYSLAKELQHYFKLKINAMAIADLPTSLASPKKIEIISAKLTSLASLQIQLKSEGQLETPFKLIKTLQLAKIRPKNLLSDLTNLVMLEVGQPLLAFNGNMIKEPSFHSAIKAYPGQEFNIYHDDIVLQENALVFHNLGIGTEATFKVTTKTLNCFLISVNPDLTLMQAQTRRHDVDNNILLSRLNKPVPPDYYLIALQRFLYLLKSITPYQILKFSDDLPNQFSQATTKINWKQINHILGTNYSSATITTALQQIGCQVTDLQKDLISVTLPPHRNDLNLINDFAEEVMRIIGYNTLKGVKPDLSFNVMQPANSLQTLLIKFRQFLINKGFNQVKTYSLTSKQATNDFNYFNYQIPITLIAPNSQERVAMRLSLIESLMNICQANVFHKQNEQLKFFTDDVIYSNDEGNDEHFLAFLAYESFFDQSITLQGFNHQPFFIMKGLFESFIDKTLKLPIRHEFTYQPIDLRFLNPYASFNVYYQKQQIATIASTHPSLTKAFGFGQPAFFAEVNCSRLQEIIKQFQPEKVLFKKWSKYNPLSRDLSFIVGETVKYGTIETAILETKIPDLVAIKLIDCYSDQQLVNQSLYSMTVNLQFNSELVQLDDEKINPAFANIKALLMKHFAAQIR